MGTIRLYGVDVLLRPLWESRFGTTGVMMLLVCAGEIDSMIYGKAESESRKNMAKKIKSRRVPDR
jgi:hypothetical protein